MQIRTHPATIQLVIVQIVIAARNAPVAPAIRQELPNIVEQSLLAASQFLSTFPTDDYKTGQLSELHLIADRYHGNYN